MKILNCYAGIGGNRKLWQGHEITAIEINPDIAKLYNVTSTCIHKVLNKTRWKYV